MLSIDNLISGEKLQLLCNIIIAFPENITRNPLINHNVKKGNIKFININDLLKMPTNSYNNPKIIFDTSEPDIHLCIMRRCKNLLVHRGGFSILGVILFNGYNLYITNEFELANNKDFFFKHKIILIV